MFKIYCHILKYKMWSFKVMFLIFLLLLFFHKKVFFLFFCFYISINVFPPFSLSSLSPTFLFPHLLLLLWFSSEGGPFRISVSHGISNIKGTPFLLQLNEAIRQEKRVPKADSRVSESPCSHCQDSHRRMISVFRISPYHIVSKKENVFYFIFVHQIIANIVNI